MNKSTTAVFLLASLMLSMVMADSDPPPPSPKVLEFMKVSQKLHDRVNLKYGDKCIYEQSLKVRALRKQVVEATMDGSLESKIDQFTKDIKPLLNSTYCDNLQALQCNKNNSCGCLSVSESGLELHAEVEQNKCRLTKGSPCFNGFYSRIGVLADLRCKSGSKCMLKSDGKTVCAENSVPEGLEFTSCECM